MSKNTDLKTIQSISISFDSLKNDNVVDIKKHQDFFRYLFFGTNDLSGTISISQLNKDNFLKDFNDALKTLEKLIINGTTTNLTNLTPLEKSLISLAFKGNIEKDFSSLKTTLFQNDIKIKNNF